MTRQTIKILIFLFLIGCNNIDYKPKYRDYTNAWESENLIGKVKSLEEYKAIVTDFKTGKTEEPFIKSKTEFTTTGQISSKEYLDDFGKLELSIKNKFGSNGFRIESTSKDFTTPSKTIETVTFDTLIGKQIYSHVFFNDSLNFDIFFEYDSNENLIAQKSIENGDTTLNRFEYKHDSIGNMLFRKQIQLSEYGENEYINLFHYNQKGLLIKLTNKSEFGEMSSKYEYDKENRITTITEYDREQIEKETLFDKFYNQTLMRFYENDSLTREMKYEYNFDRIGNWIERKVFMKEHFGKSKTWTPIFVETRVIEYYK